MTTSHAYDYHPLAAHLLITSERNPNCLTWGALEVAADRVEACERMAAEIRAQAEDDWQAELINAIEAEGYDD